MISIGFHMARICPPMSIIEIVLIPKRRTTHAGSNATNPRSVGLAVCALFDKGGSEISKNPRPERRFSRKLHVRSFSNFFPEYILTSANYGQNIKALISRSSESQTSEVTIEMRTGFSDLRPSLGFLVKYLAVDYR